MFKMIAKQYHREFGFNVFPLIGKVPKVKWEEWQSKRQAVEDLVAMDWNSSTTGIGAAAGLDDVRNIDIDKITDWEVLKIILEKLHLDLKYPWIVKTGSGAGVHIYIKVKESEKVIQKLGGEKAVYRFKLKQEGVCDHIEIRWSKCQNVLPPSKHPSGGTYQFNDVEPKDSPVEIAEELFLKMIDELFIIESKERIRSMKLGSRRPKYLNPRVDYKTLEKAIAYLGENLPESCYEDWYRIGFGLASIGEQGRKYFNAMSMANKNYSDTDAELNKRYDSFLTDYDGRITLGTVYAIAENYGWERPKITFWFNNEGKTKLKQRKFIEFLESCGHYKLYLNPGYTLIKIKDNVVEEIEPVKIKDFVMDYVYQISEEELDGTERTELLDTIVKGNNVYFGKSYFEFLSPIELSFNRDSAEKSYLYFKNGFVEVTNNDVVLKPYKELSGYIWKYQIMEREYKAVELKSDFETLLLNICRADQTRFNSLRSAIGYLLHTYKDVALTKAIIFIDENMSDGANGRSCKSLVGVAISQIRKTLRIDARNFDFRSTFAFQSVTLDTNIVEFNDVQKKFPFERLFSIITDGITVEKKNKDQMTIPFSESPKILISTNYTIEGVDMSTLDRQFIIEFSDFYNEQHRPINDFGKRLFEQWNENEWVRFDNFMIGCIQFNLSNGLVGYSYVNLLEKKLIDMTCKEFAEFMTDFNVGNEFEKKAVFTEFKELYEDYSTMKQNTFTKWLKVYCKLKGYDIEEWRNDKTYFFKIKLRKVE